MTSSTDPVTGLETGPKTTLDTGDSTGDSSAAREAASTAADRGRDVAATAASEAKDVAGEAAARARDVVGDARTQVAGHLDEQSRTQKDRLVGALHGVGDDLDAMAGSGTDEGLASDLVREAAQRAREVTGWLESRDPSQLLDDVRDFARRRPGTFLLASLAAGVVVGRLARGAKQAQQDQTDATGGTSSGSSTPYAGPVTPPRPVTETAPPTSQTSPPPALPAEPVGGYAGPGEGGSADPLTEGAQPIDRPATGGGPA